MDKNENLGKYCFIEITFDWNRMQRETMQLSFCSSKDFRHFAKASTFLC